MNYSENPLKDLHDAMAHAEYVGFSDIEYENRDWETYRATGEDNRVPKTRRPTTYAFGVYAMFQQTWGSTALGHGGAGAASMSTAYTIVLECQRTGEFLVYFGGRHCYTINRSNANIQQFVEDCGNHNLASKRQSEKYQMSHDRGCPCGRESYDYDTCNKDDCMKKERWTRFKTNKTNKTKDEQLKQYIWVRPGKELMFVTDVIALYKDSKFSPNTDKLYEVGAEVEVEVSVKVIPA